MRDDGRSDSPTTGGDRNDTPRLVHLDDMDELQVADGDPDVRGWDVRLADGEKIGKVKDLIIDTGLMKVRYIEAEIDKETLNASDDRAVLIPIGSARLDDEEDNVFLSASIVDPRTLPPYDRNSLSREYELTLRERFTRDPHPSETERIIPLTADKRSATDGDFYGEELYDDSRFFGERRRGRESSSYISPLSDDAMRRRNESL